MSKREIEIDVYTPGDPMELPAWYEQYLELDSSGKKAVLSNALRMLKKGNPDTYEVLMKEGWKLVGLTPHIAYAADPRRESREDQSTTWVHGFTIPTLVFWHDDFSAGLFVNANLRYNDSVLNHLPGNSRESIKGFTG